MRYIGYTTVFKRLETGKAKDNQFQYAFMLFPSNSMNESYLQSRGNFVL